MNTTPKLLISALLLAGSALSAQAAVLVGWDVNGVSQSSSDTTLGSTENTTGIVASDLVINTVNGTDPLDPQNSNNSWRARDWDQTSLADAITTGDYMSFSVTADTGYTFDVSSVTVSFGGNSGLLPANTFLMSSLTGFTDGDELATTSYTSAAGNYDTAQTYAITSSALQGISSVEFRLYGIGASRFSQAGIVNAETGADLFVEGSTAIPEPSTFALMAGALGLAVVMLRRRRG